MAVTVTIAGKQYSINGLDSAYVSSLAMHLETKMTAARESSPDADETRVAVLAALNICDELFKARQDRIDTLDEFARRIGHGILRSKGYTNG